MKRYGQVFRMHKLLLCLPIVVALVGAMFFELRTPKQYVTQGTLWVDAPVPGESTIFSQPNPSPAAQGTLVMQELLHSDSFLQKVGAAPAWNEAHLNSAQVQGLLGTVPKSVAVATVGPQIMSVSSKSQSPPEAVAMDKAVMQAFVGTVSATQQARNQSQLAYDQQVLTSAGKALTDAQQQLNRYLRSNPAVAGESADPNLTQLTNNLSLAQQNFGAAQAAYNKDSVGGSQLSASQLHILDNPGSPYTQSRKKKIIMAGVGGLLAGLVITILIMSRLIANDTSPYDADDVEGLGLDVVGAIRQLPRRPMRRRAS
jgi:uncharacterized protein involved in exopolysaccharide biosynthesis